MVTDSNSPLNFLPQRTLQGSEACLSHGFQRSLKSTLPCGENRGGTWTGKGHFNSGLRITGLGQAVTEQRAIPNVDSTPSKMSDCHKKTCLY